MAAQSTLDWISEQLHPERATSATRLQTLWSGYGEILRVSLDGSVKETCIAKHVRPPSEAAQHPRGFGGGISHRRKLASYSVERCFYERYAPRCLARVAALLGAEDTGQERLLLLEDLDAAGFKERRETPSEAEILACLDWLARFHASFFGSQTDGLWPVGTYWHLETRPEEYARMPEGPLKAAAKTLDGALRGARYQTLVHGDAKVANFCFPASSGPVAAVDFQYVGRGAGIRDVVYFFSSCLTSEACEELCGDLLDAYFGYLDQALSQSEVDCTEVEREWRALYPIAWADFHRFLAGWAPGHWKRHAYCQSQTALALGMLGHSGLGTTWKALETK